MFAVALDDDEINDNANVGVTPLGGARHSSADFDPFRRDTFSIIEENEDEGECN